MVLVFFLAASIFAGGQTTWQAGLAKGAIALAALVTAWSLFFLRWDSLLSRGRLPLAVTLVMLFDVGWLTLFVLATGGSDSPYSGLLLLPVIFSAVFFGEADYVTPLTAFLVSGIFVLLAAARGDVGFSATCNTLGHIMLVLIVAWFCRGLTRVVDRERQINQRIVSNLTEGVLLVDVSGRVLMTNSEMARLCGLTVEDLIGLDLPQAGNKQGYALLQEMTAGLMHRPSEPVHAEMTLSGRETVDVRCTVIPFGAKNLLGWVLVVQDITGFKALARMKEQGLSILSHELRSPLAAMSGMCTVLTSLTLSLSEEDKTRAIQVMAEESERLSRLVSELLDVSQIEHEVQPLEKQPVVVGQLAQALVDLYARRASEKGVRLVAEIPPNMPPVLGDFGHLKQLLSNLVDNALKYTLPGGEVRITASASDGRGQIQISDSGPGISPQHLESIFEKFGRVNVTDTNVKGFQGLGIGLYVARLLARRHGGDLVVDSTVGVGSTFTLILPLA